MSDGREASAGGTDGETERVRRAWHEGVVFRRPVEPRPSAWRLPDPDDADRHGLCAVGADLRPGTLLAAYRSGLFAMPVR